MSSFCFGQQALLQGKNTESKPQAPQAGKSKSPKYKTPGQTRPLAVKDSHWSTKKIVAFFVVIITVIIFGSVVVQRTNGTTQGNLITITIK